MKEFSKEKILEIKQMIDRSLEKDEVNPVAAFDADGTLWSCDMGEVLFEYQIKNNLLPDLQKNAMDHYRQLRGSADPRKAFLWLAQINKGLPIEQIREWASIALGEMGDVPIFPAKKEIIDHLHRRGVETYVVTASVKWSVEPAAKLYNIPYENVIGVSTKVVDGIITDEQDGPITYRQGKVDALLLNTENKRPFFCAGNTEGDLPLLESATHLQLVMASADESHVNFETEQEMLEIAKQRDWFFHSFV